MCRLNPDAGMKGVRPVLWIPTADSLRSGWAWGRGYLKDTVGGFEATMGKGRVIVFGPEITFRGQPHGAFKFLFNGIYLGGAQNANLAQADREVGALRSRQWAVGGQWAAGRRPAAHCCFRGGRACDRAPGEVSNPRARR